MYHDFETGEFIEKHAHRKSRRPKSVRYDLETGEPECHTGTTNTTPPARKGRHFNVPRDMLPQPPQPQSLSTCSIDGEETYSLFPKGQLLTLQEEIIMGYNTTSHRLFFVVITLLYLLTRHCVVFAILIEFVMHAYAHNRNGQNLNPGVYYRSPLHIFTSRFCLSCRLEVAMDRVIKLQDQRTKRWQLSLREVARTIS